MANRKLSKYRAKRDFHKTAEPSGARRVARVGRLRFVIQKHAARRLHYDLRLELDGVFKSWAVTRGPSLDPADKRLAVEVEDHPLDYGDFEGTIPKGEYGGGTVQLWDRGYWIPEGGRIRREALAAGDLKFILEGERLHGSWVLVRMSNDRYGSGKRTNWLLIKHRDEFARPGDHDAVLAEDRSVASGRAMAMIEAGRGRAPKPFMLAGKAGQSARADAVWHSCAQLTQDEYRAGSAAAQPARTAIALHKPPPVRATRQQRLAAPHAHCRSSFLRSCASCSIVRRPGPAGLTRSSWMAIGCSCGSRGGEATLKTRKGLDWTRKFTDDCAPPRKLCPTASSMARWSP